MTNIELTKEKSIIKNIELAKENNKEFINKNCICKKVECIYHGKCKPCIEKHKKDGNKPHCMR